MIDFFLSLDKAVQAAIIAAFGGILVAIINGLFSLINNRKKRNHKTSKSTADKVSINQTSNGHHNTFIGIQNIRKEDK